MYDVSLFFSLFVLLVPCSRLVGWFGRSVGRLAGWCCCFLESVWARDVSHKHSVDSKCVVSWAANVHTEPRTILYGFFSLYRFELNYVYKMKLWAGERTSVRPKKSYRTLFSFRIVWDRSFIALNRQNLNTFILNSDQWSCNRWHTHRSKSVRFIFLI